jgi:hypothetical protein
MHPILHNPDAYFDHEPPCVAYMMNICDRFSESNMAMWTQYSQQLTGERVCIDSTWKVAKRMIQSSGRTLWSMMDVDTGCILTQQVLTHEAAMDVLPMMSSYAARCKELSVPLPRRVCSDRGLMDENMINHPDAFPDAHINVDPWHFHQLFGKRLNKGVDSDMWKSVAKEFNAAMYVITRWMDPPLALMRNLTTSLLLLTDSSSTTLTVAVEEYLSSLHPPRRGGRHRKGSSHRDACAVIQWVRPLLSA